MEAIYPREYKASVKGIDFERLYKKGYRGVLFDVDNTLVPFDEMDASEELIAFVTGLQTIGFKVGLVSNNTRSRVQALNRKLNLEIMPNAMKPLTYKLRRILKTMGLTPRNSVFVGDQLFTDVWVGNSMGLYTVLVKPIQKKEQLITRVKRGIEGKILARYMKKYDVKL